MSSYCRTIAAKIPMLDWQRRLALLCRRPSFECQSLSANCREQDYRVQYRKNEGHVPVRVLSNQSGCTLFRMDPEDFQPCFRPFCVSSKRKYKPSRTNYVPM